jgi:hypothetical protein
MLTTSRCPLSLAISCNMDDAALIQAMPHFLRQRRYFEYDTCLFGGLRATVTEVISPGLNPEQLQALHNSEESQAILRGHTVQAPNHMGRLVFNKRWKLGCKADGFRLELGLFMERVVRPLLWSGLDAEHATLGEVVYQQEPTLRVQLPGQRALGNPHIDYQYMRQPTEVNVWLPLTKVTEQNTLYTESQPGAGDFSPLLADFGTGVLFYGSQCRHYSVNNSSETLTRVSMDFRCIRDDHFITEYISPISQQGKALFRLGEHYTSTRLEREWRLSRGWPA